MSLGERASSAAGEALGGLLAAYFAVGLIYGNASEFFGHGLFGMSGSRIVVKAIGWPWYIMSDDSSMPWERTEERERDEALRDVARESMRAVIAQGLKAEKESGKSAALEIYRTACAKDVGVACAMQGVALLRDAEGLLHDHPATLVLRRAVPILRRECELGLGEACMYLGLIQDRGLGLQESRSAAAEFYRRAVELGIKFVDPLLKCAEGKGEVCFALSMSFVHDDSDAVDKHAALLYGHRACELGSQEACELLGSTK